MTAVAPLPGARSTGTMTWDAIDWYAVYRTVRRLQARMVQAVQAGRWGTVHALHHLLTHACSGKVLAVKRVTANDGRKTPGVDGGVWDTPEKNTCALRARRQRGYRALPLRGLSLPQHDGTHRRADDTRPHRSTAMAVPVETARGSLPRLPSAEHQTDGLAQPSRRLADLWRP